MAVCLSLSSSQPSSLSFSLSSEFCGNGKRVKPDSLSWSSSFPQLKISTAFSPCHRNLPRKQNTIVAAAYTRRSRSEAAKKPNRKSWKQRTDPFMRPFKLDVFFSRRFIQAKVVHRHTSKVISVATTNAKDLRTTLPSLIDNNAAKVIGKLIAERSKDADVFAMTYEPRDNERIEGRLGIVLDTIAENGIIFV